MQVRMCVCRCVRACTSGWLHACTSCGCNSRPSVYVSVCACLYVPYVILKQLRLCVCLFVCVFVCVRRPKSLTIVTMKTITAKAAGALTCLTSWRRMRRSCTLRCSWKRDVDATRTTQPRCSSLHLF